MILKNIIIIFSFFFITSCYLKEGKSNKIEDKESYYPNKLNSDIGKGTYFITLNDVSKSIDEAQLDIVFLGKLIINNNCLSIYYDNENVRKIYTVVIPENINIIFDSNNNIIGLENSKLKKKYELKNNILIGGMATINKDRIKKKIPDQCSQNILLPGAFL